MDKEQEILDNLENLDKSTYPIDADDGVLDYSELIGEEAFIGEVPYDTIIECITKQFEDYITYVHDEDSTDYVDIFYDQLHASREVIENDDEEEHPQEIKEVLDKLETKFVSFMREMFDTRLTIGIMDSGEDSSGDVEDDEMESILRSLYTFFILNARNNFKVVIAKDIIQNNRIDFNTENNNEFYSSVKTVLDDYSPIIRNIGADEFLKYCDENDIIELYSDGKITGNFLRKYSCKLYRNYEYETELVSYIIILQGLKEDIKNG